MKSHGKYFLLFAKALITVYLTQLALTNQKSVKSTVGQRFSLPNLRLQSLNQHYK